MARGRQRERETDIERDNVGKKERKSSKIFLLQFAGNFIDFEKDK